MQDIEAGAKRSASNLALNELARSRNTSRARGLNELANGTGTGSGTPIGNGTAAATNGHAAAVPAGVANGLGAAVAKAFAANGDSAAENTPNDSPKKTSGVVAPGMLPGAESSARRWVHWLAGGQAGRQAGRDGSA